MAGFRLIQTNLSWEDPAANRAHLADKLAGTPGHLNILPEMFTTGFSMASATLAEPADGPTLDWLNANAETQHMPVCGSVMVREAKHCYNRFFHVTPSGDVQRYDKRHLFRMADEHQHYSPGQHRLVFQQQDMRVMAQVCYDLRFPVYSRNRNDYDVLLYVANWPAARREHWLTLLKARAIENLCYVIGVNRIGDDGNQVAYSGDSVVFDFRGEPLLELGGADAAAEIELEMAPLTQYRRDFPAWQDADDFALSE